MHTIEIDFDVFKALTTRRASEEESYNDVIRGLLDLPPGRAGTITSPGQPNGDGWRVKGALFPNGTEFRARYKGENHLGKVERGALVLKGKRFDSPSAAAVSITGAAVNGWNFWQARLPGRSEWRVIAGFRS